MNIKDTRLAAYADMLESAGFTIWEPRTPGNYFKYSHDVDGVECFGYVQADYWGEISHSMPIAPSIENGNMAYVFGVNGELTVEAAEKVAQPYNICPYVTPSNQANYALTERGVSIYRKRGA